MQEAFKVIEPSGKTYRVYSDGRIEGFERGAVIVNYLPSLLLSARNMSHASACPTNNEVPSRVGEEQGLAPSTSNCAENISTAPGEK